MIQIYLFAGVAGSGKSSIINGLLERNKEYIYIPSVTTRKKRNGEIEGNPYYFVDQETFDKYEEENKFLETERVHGNSYGTLKDKYYDALGKEFIILKDIDVKGAVTFQKQFGKEVFSFFIEPKNEKDILNRMLNRGDSSEDIQKRIERVEFEKSYKKFFDQIIINDSLDDSIKEIEYVIHKNSRKL